MIDRRAFLKRLGFGTVAACAAANGLIDIERLLWMPDKAIILPAVEVYGSGFNTLITPEWIVGDTLQMFRAQCKLVRQFNRAYEATFHAPPAESSALFRPRERRWVTAHVVRRKDATI